MKRLLFSLLMAIVAMNLAACNTLNHQPRLAAPTLVPDKVMPGQSPILTVKLTDQYRIVSRVIATVRDHPETKFELRDDGKAPDKTALDGIWTAELAVPFMAPPGSFTLDISGYNKKDAIILVRKTKDEDGPLTESVSFSIVYPDK